MQLREAVADKLAQSRTPLITEYDFFVLSHRLFAAGSYEGNRIVRLAEAWDASRARRLIRRLEKAGALVPDPDFSGVWRVLNAEGPGSTEEACCLVDPFCYVSHSTALQRYGLTDRSPLHVQITRPSRPIWRRLAVERMGKDLKDFPSDLDHPALLHVGFHERIRRRPVQVFETKRPAIPRPIRGEHARISSVGRTFADTLDESYLCGGMEHVLEIWEAHAVRYLDEIIRELESHPKKLTRVRAGYILQERLGVHDDRVSAWQALAQRGGSQRLDPERPYEPNYSEAWMLSINV